MTFIRAAPGRWCRPAGKCPLRWVDVGMVFNGGVALGCALVFTAIYMRIGD